MRAFSVPSYPWMGGPLLSRALCARAHIAQDARSRPLDFDTPTPSCHAVGIAKRRAVERAERPHQGGSP